MADYAYVVRDDLRGLDLEQAEAIPIASEA